MPTIRSPLLRRFWFTFDPFAELTPLRLGCGVTAFTYDDALSLLKAEIFGVAANPPIATCIEDIDVSTLDAGHVIPNMGDVTVRGIWFPLAW
jgi:hypothetical protein